MKSTIKIIISWLLVFIWMLVIFSFSNMNKEQSSNVSKGLISNTVITSYEVGNKLGIVDNIPSDNEINKIVLKTHVPVRKIAHFTEYLILSLLVINALRNSGVKDRVLVSTFLICVIYSCSDELHQIFISGRAGKIIDIIIDSCGSIFGILVYKFIKKI